MSRFDDLILGQPLPATISCDFPLRFNGCRRGGLLYSARSRDFAQPVVAAAAAARYALDKHEITNRVLGLLRSFPFADPAKSLGQETQRGLNFPLLHMLKRTCISSLSATTTASTATTTTTSSAPSPLKSLPATELKQENEVQKTSIPLFSFITQMKQENKVEQPKLICA